MESDVSHLNQAFAVRNHRTEVVDVTELAAVNSETMATPGPTVFCGLPLFHVNGQLATGLLRWSSGAHVVLRTPQGYRAPGWLPHFWALVEHLQVPWFSGVPTVYAAGATRGARYFEPGLRRVRCAPMPRELIADFQRETGVKIVEGYALTECPSASRSSIACRPRMLADLQAGIGRDGGGVRPLGRAEEYGLVLTFCQAVRDERKGVVFNWTVEGNSEGLISRLDKYPFAHEMV